MKQYTTIIKSDKVFLRLKNPLENDGRLVSRAAYEDFERLYNDSALLLIDPIPGREIYLDSEVFLQWRFREKSNLVWKNITEPGFVDTLPEQYQQVFMIHETKPEDFQENVTLWLSKTFGADYLANRQERNFRFLEEALELVQCLGMPHEDVLRMAVRTYSRPEGLPHQEVGGALVTLAGICAANMIDMFRAGEEEIANNWKNSESIKQKHLLKIKEGIAQ